MCVDPFFPIEPSEGSRVRLRKEVFSGFQLLRSELERRAKVCGCLDPPRGQREVEGQKPLPLPLPLEWDNPPHSSPEALCVPDVGG
jgi:hypothetical protein